MKQSESDVRVSIIIPTRNEVAFISRCLGSIHSADAVDGGIEIIVVDGMSSDGTREIVNSWVGKFSSLKLLDNERQIVPTAMNIGINAARGEWIIRLDAHSEYPSDYLNRCLETSKRTGADNVGGCVVTLFEIDGFQGRLVQALTTHSFGVGNSTFRTGGREGWVDTVPFGCYHREVFTRIGTYDERLVRNQDYELNRRLVAQGGRIWFDPAIRIVYHNQATLRGLLRQAFMTGQWNPWMWYVAHYSFAWRHAIPMFFTAALLFLPPMFLVGFQLGVGLLSATLLPYLMLNLSATLQQARRFGATLFAVLPILFFVYHVVYGLGGLWGLLRLAACAAPVQAPKHTPR